jgi:hypothetical protein
MAIAVDMRDIDCNKKRCNQNTKAQKKLPMQAENAGSQEAGRISAGGLAKDEKK